MASMEKIRSEQPVKNTTHNLIQTLSTKLDSAARYGLYVDDAHKDGYEDCAQVFERLAEREQEMIGELITCLQKRIGQETER
jgi:rubrerythrin